jgi:hypothetical protein
VKIAFPLRIAAIGLFLACVLAHPGALAWPCILLFSSLPDRTSRIGQTAGSSLA